MKRKDYSFVLPTKVPSKNRANVPVTFALATCALVTLGGSNEYLKVTSEVCLDSNSISVTLTSFLTEDSVFSPLVLPERTTSESDYMLAKLEVFFKKLNVSGWDGYNAYPIEEVSYGHAVSIIKNTPEDVLRLWNVFPSPNGTISFEFKAREIAAMSVGNNGFSYAAMKGNEEPIMGEMGFDVTEASKALIKMSRLLGYLG